MVRNGKKLDPHELITLWADLCDQLERETTVPPSLVDMEEQIVDMEAKLRNL